MEKRMSPYNPCLEETVQDIVFCDVTMREGEQAPGVGGCIANTVISRKNKVRETGSQKNCRTKIERENCH